MNPPDYGFVYLMWNESMPDLYKIGKSIRSPHQRAAELSAPSGIPTPFKVACYIEHSQHSGAERILHNLLRQNRVNSGREFFRFADDEEAHGRAVDFVVRVLKNFPGTLSFSTSGCHEMFERTLCDLALIDNGDPPFSADCVQQIRSCLFGE